MIRKRLSPAEVPTVMALLHHPGIRAPIRVERELLAEGEAAIVRHIRARTRKFGPGTLFIEGIGRSTGRDFFPDPYSRAIEEAIRHGWKIVGLDRRSRLRASQATPPYSLQQRFMMYDGRERDWPQVLARHDARSNDLVVMHPSHVVGFLGHSAFPSSCVTWIHAPKPILAARRLVPTEVTEFVNLSRNARIIRKLARRKPRVR